MLTVPYFYFTMNFPIGIIHPESNMMKSHDLSKLYLQLHTFFSELLFRNYASSGFSRNPRVSSYFLNLSQYKDLNDSHSNSSL